VSFDEVPQDIETIEEDPREDWPKLSHGETVSKRDVGLALGAPLPLPNERLTSQEHQDLRLAFLSATEAWKTWHMQTHAIAISSAPGCFVGMWPGEQIQKANSQCERRIRKALRREADLLRFVRPGTDEDREILMRAKMVAEARRRASE
jgi:hypothetical protein